MRAQTGLFLAISALIACGDGEGTINANMTCDDFCEDYEAACSTAGESVSQCQACMDDAEVPISACAEPVLILNNATPQQCAQVLDEVLATGNGASPASCLQWLFGGS